LNEPVIGQRELFHWRDLTARIELQRDGFWRAVCCNFNKFRSINFLEASLEFFFKASTARTRTIKRQ
jgi:hypothetical protein